MEFLDLIEAASGAERREAVTVSHKNKWFYGATSTKCKLIKWELPNVNGQPDAGCLLVFFHEISKWHYAPASCAANTSSRSRAGVDAEISMTDFGEAILASAIILPAVFIYWPRQSFSAYRSTPW
jgi:hypothetical protein